jgi:hypothetical protein
LWRREGWDKTLAQLLCPCLFTSVSQVRFKGALFEGTLLMLGARGAARSFDAPAAREEDIR